MSGELKGLVLSGGVGTRLRPITHTSAKQLVPVANKPILFYGIESLVEAGVTDIGIIIAPETGAEIRDAVGTGGSFGANITWIEQDQPAGLAHAVLTARDFIGSDPFVMYLGDNLLRDGIQDFVESFHASRPDALVLLTAVDDPSSYGVAELDGEKIVRLVEKPREPISDLALVGVYLFTESIFPAAAALKPSWRGELEITEAIQGLIDGGQKVEYEVVTGWWKDTGALADMLEANRLVLAETETDLVGEVLDSEIDGEVFLAEGARLVRTRVSGPAVIGQDCLIEDSIIGPNCSIGASVVIRNSRLEDSIILDGCRIEGVESGLRGSLLGRDVEVTRAFDSAGAAQLMVGDNSRVELS